MPPGMPHFRPAGTDSVPVSTGNPLIQGFFPRASNRRSVEPFLLEG